MVRMGIVRQSSRSWAATLRMLPKFVHEWRPCEDYRVLNSTTIPDRYPVRHVHDFSYSLRFKNIFSKIDLVRAYYQIPVAKEVIP